MAAIIGCCLLESGTADRVVRSALKICSVEGAPVAFLFSGFLLTIPVFFDIVFYLMMPLGKAMRLRTGKHYLLYIMTIIAGGTMAHSLGPPTPGPLVIAEILGASIGVIIAGGIVGPCTAAAGYVYSFLVLNALRRCAFERNRRYHQRRVAGDFRSLRQRLALAVLVTGLNCAASAADQYRDDYQNDGDQRTGSPDPVCTDHRR